MMAKARKPSALRIKQRKLADLSPYGNNPKEHDEASITGIARSIKEFGFLVPIVIADDEIVAGHGRYEAAKNLGLTFVPTIDVSRLSRKQRKAFMIADNRLPEVGTQWNWEALQREYEELLDFDLSLTGFDEVEWDDIMNPPDDGTLPPGDLDVVKSVVCPHCGESFEPSNT